MATVAMFSLSSDVDADLASLLVSGAGLRGSLAGVVDREREVDGRVRWPLPQEPGTNSRLSMVKVLAVCKCLRGVVAAGAEEYWRAKQ